MTHPNLYQLSHGWASQYYWFSLVQDVYVGMDFIDGIRKSNLTLGIKKGTTEADAHGCTMALTFYSEKVVSVLKSHSAKSFKDYPIHFTNEANIRSKYFYLDIIGKIPDVRSKDILKEPDLAQYCKKNGITKSDLIKVSTNPPLYANFSQWDGSDLFTINNTLILIVSEKVKNELSNKKAYKNLRLEKIKFLDE